MKKYYIAYASNLKVRRMKMRCPTAMILGTAVLNGWELLFKGIKTGRQHTLTAFVYIMHEERPLGIPTDFYLRTCIEGYSVFGFDKLPLTAAYERSWEVCGYEE